MSLLTPFGYLDIQLTIKYLIITHYLACWGLLCTSFLFVKALLKVSNQFPVSWFRFVILMCWMYVNRWLRGFSFCESVITALFGNFVLHDWGLHIYMNYAFELWVEAFTVFETSASTLGFHRLPSHGYRAMELAHGDGQIFGDFIQMKTFLFRCKRIIRNPRGLMTKLRARQGGPVRDDIVTVMILFYLLQIYGCIVDWRPVRHRLYVVSILFTLSWVSLKNLFALHALVRGTKQLCFFP